MAIGGKAREADHKGDQFILKLGPPVIPHVHAPKQRVSNGRLAHPAASGYMPLCERRSSKSHEMRPREVAHCSA